MATATLTSKGQMTLPKSVRDELGLKPGDKVDFIKEGDAFVLKPRTRNLADFAGILGAPPSGKGMTVEEMDEAIGAHLAGEDERIRARRR